MYVYKESNFGYFYWNNSEPLEPKNRTIQNRNRMIEIYWNRLKPEPKVIWNLEPEPKNSGIDQALLNNNRIQQGS